LLPTNIINAGGKIQAPMVPPMVTPPVLPIQATTAPAVTTEKVSLPSNLGGGVGDDDEKDN